MNSESTASVAQATQQALYASIARDYDSLHVDPEHAFALQWLQGVIRQLGVRSVLDVGAGTGRAMLDLKSAFPEIRVAGVEPVAELREVAYSKGIPREDLVAGSGYELPFEDGQFDFVCEVGVLHHVADPERLLREMIRVARRGIFVSDSNNFGGGSRPARLAKRCFYKLGLWRPLQFLITKGKGYHVTEGDGLFYSYSVFQNFNVLNQLGLKVHMLNTVAPTRISPDMLWSATHIAYVALKGR